MEPNALEAETVYLLVPIVEEQIETPVAIPTAVRRTRPMSSDELETALAASREA